MSLESLPKCLLQYIFEFLDIYSQNRFVQVSKKCSSLYYKDLSDLDYLIIREKLNTCKNINLNFIKNIVLTRTRSGTACLDIENLPNLQQLILNCTGYDLRIPYTGNLTYLDISNCSTRSRYGIEICMLENLKTLKIHIDEDYPDLSYNTKLHTLHIHGSIFNGFSLRNLNLHCLKFYCLSVDARFKIPEMSNLISLRITYHFDYNDIVKFTNLKKLSIVQNNYFENLEFCKDLISLNCASTNLTNKHIKHLNLRKLICYQTKITNLMHMTNLVYLETNMPKKFMLLPYNYLSKFK